MNDKDFLYLSEIDKKDWAKRECKAILHQLEMIEKGLAVRYAGLVYYLPLCHDAYGENI